MTSLPAFIHPLACVTDSEIGARSHVWQFASVIRGAVIGEDCTIASGALVDGSRIGNHSIVGQNVAMGPGFVIGREVFIGPNVTLCNDMWPRASKAYFPGFVAAVAFCDDEQRKKHAAIVIEDGAAIGANAVIMPGVVIGRGSMVAAGAVVSVSLAPMSLHLRDGSVRKLTGATEKEKIAKRIRYAVRRDVALGA